MANKLVLALVLVVAGGCGGDVVVDGEPDPGPLPVGEDDRVDPETVCREIVARFDALDCQENITGRVSCERGFRAANEQGCTEQMLAWFECATRSCDSCWMVSEPCEWECDAPGEAMVACFADDPSPASRDASSSSSTSAAASGAGGAGGAAE